MTSLEANTVVLILGQIITAFAVYSGIRADLRNHHERILRLERLEDERGKQ